MTQAAQLRRTRGGGAYGRSPGTGAPRLGGRWAGWVLAFALLLSALCTTVATAHQVLEGARATVVDAATPIVGTDDPAAPARGPEGRPAHRVCTGHCVSHVASLPPRLDVALQVSETGAAWSVADRPTRPARSPARLDRPPRT